MRVMGYNRYTNSGSTTDALDRWANGFHEWGTHPEISTEVRSLVDPITPLFVVTFDSRSGYLPASEQLCGIRSLCNEQLGPTKVSTYNSHDEGTFAHGCSSPFIELSRPLIDGSVHHGTGDRVRACVRKHAHGWEYSTVRVQHNRMDSRAHGMRVSAFLAMYLCCHSKSPILTRQLRLSQTLQAEQVHISSPSQSPISM